MSESSIKSIRGRPGLPTVNPGLSYRYIAMRNRARDEWVIGAPGDIFQLWLALEPLTPGDGLIIEVINLPDGLFDSLPDYVKIDAAPRTTQGD